MTELPDFFQDQDDYDDWIDRVVDERGEGVLMWLDEPVTLDDLEEFIAESDILATRPDHMAGLFTDVREFGYNTGSEVDLTLPDDDPFEDAADWTRDVLITDLAVRMGLMVKDSGLEVDIHACEDNALWNFREFEIDPGNKPPTGTVPGKCETCGRTLLLTLEVTGVLDRRTREPV